MNDEKNQDDYFSKKVVYGKVQFAYHLFLQICKSPSRIISLLSIENLKKFTSAIKNEDLQHVYYNIKTYLDRNSETISEPVELLSDDESLSLSLTKNVVDESKIKELESRHPGITDPVGIGNAYALEFKLRPIPVEINPQKNPKINFLLPQLDPLIMFGGYIACIQFIKHLIDNNHQVRILLCESDTFDRKAVLEKLNNNPSLRYAVEQCEIIPVANKEKTVVISNNDAFIAYSFWTALLADSMAKSINKKFIFFLQEFECIFHPYDSFYALGEYVYNLPHYALFNTEILRDYFRKKRLGVFKNSLDDGETNSIAFQHALTPTSPPSLEDLAKRKVKRLLFYGRPENHAKRNLFEIALIGIRMAVHRGVFDADEWEFIGVGTLGTCHEVPLGNGKVLYLKSALPLNDYAKSLRSFDVGMSLMFAPHPSIIPFEMASSGIVTVTNTFGPRNAEMLQDISENICPCEPNMYAVADALEAAVVKSCDHEKRLLNSKIDWVMDWNDSFHPKFMNDFKKFIQG